MPCPRAHQYPATQDAERLHIDMGRCRKHLARLKAAPGLAQKLEEVFTKPAPENFEAQDPDLMIYSGGFLGNADKTKLSRLREMSPEQLALAHPEFDDLRLPEMLFRYRARNYPETLNEGEQTRWEQFRRRRLTEKGFGGGVVSMNTRSGWRNWKPGLKTAQGTGKSWAN